MSLLTRLLALIIGTTALVTRPLATAIGTRGLMIGPLVSVTRTAAPTTKTPTLAVQLPYQWHSQQMRGGGGETPYVFWKCFIKFLEIKYFTTFYKRFYHQQKIFYKFDHNYMQKQTLQLRNHFLKNDLLYKTNEVLIVKLTITCYCYCQLPSHIIWKKKFKNLMATRFM